MTNYILCEYVADLESVEILKGVGQVDCDFGVFFLVDLDETLYKQYILGFTNLEL